MSTRSPGRVCNGPPSGKPTPQRGSPSPKEFANLARCGQWCRGVSTHRDRRRVDPGHRALVRVFVSDAAGASVAVDFRFTVWARKPLSVASLPAPQPLRVDGRRRPASDANFYRPNAVVPVPPLGICLSNRVRIRYKQSHQPV